ncbi:MAG: diversity-generating retroelement protein Avd [Methylococcales bacterium]|nr:diversity-generating retroelement protein Avd [Methylococcales bacterium]MBT7444650.1 diversity-generating retroelement protein Avd [Methylococcales bacterium]
MDELPVFVDWMQFLDWFLPVTNKFPKSIRFTFSDRMQNLALDIVEDLVEARYTKNKKSILKRTNLRLEKLRILIRLSYQQKYIAHKQYEHANRAIYNVGKQIGGWMKQANA